MNSRDKKALRRKKHWDRMRWIITILAAIGLMVMGFYLYGLMLVLAFYVLHEALWSDHIFYDPRQDYQYQLDTSECLPVTWDKKQSVYTLAGIDSKADSFFLATDIKASVLGHIFDPYVEISYQGKQLKQYFERRLNGLRYVNISSLLEDLEARQAISLKIKLKHCNIKGDSARLLCFSNPGLKTKKLLVIAPHADDAELAAFALYSEQDSLVLTLTAGETEAKDFLVVDKVPEKASLLKGRLRCLDTVTAAVWGGLSMDRIINLGYFCQTLQQMQQMPQQGVASITAGTNDVRAFRAFNTVSLKTDQHGIASWQNLLDDLQEVIGHFQPDVIVTPHPELDPHSDHIYATKAVLQCLNQQAHSVTELLFYANHYHNTDLFPFGLSHTTASVPPSFDPIIPASLWSYPVSENKQKDKVFAIEVMHDLKGQLKFKKKLRRWIQAKLLGRTITPYGDDDYFRKSVRANELFYRVPVTQAFEYFND